MHLVYDSGMESSDSFQRRLVPERKGLVEFCPGRFGSGHCRIDLTDDLTRNSDHQLPRRDDLIIGDDATRPNDAIFADFNPLMQDGPHSHEDIFFDFRAVQDGPGANVAVRSQPGGLLWETMDDAVFLNI